MKKFRMTLGVKITLLAVISSVIVGLSLFVVVLINLNKLKFCVRVPISPEPKPYSYMHHESFGNAFQYALLLHELHYLALSSSFSLAMTAL